LQIRGPVGGKGFGFFFFKDEGTGYRLARPVLPVVVYPFDIVPCDKREKIVAHLCISPFLRLSVMSWNDPGGRTIFVQIFLGRLEATAEQDRG